MKLDDLHYRFEDREREGESEREWGREEAQRKYLEIYRYADERVGHSLETEWTWRNINDRRLGTPPLTKRNDGHHPAAIGLAI